MAFDGLDILPDSTDGRSELLLPKRSLSHCTLRLEGISPIRHKLCLERDSIGKSRKLGQLQPFPDVSPPQSSCTRPYHSAPTCSFLPQLCSGKRIGIRSNPDLRRVANFSP
jgi:hypothetical protein